MNIHPSIMFVFSSDQQRPLTTLFRRVVVAVALFTTTGVPQGLHHRTEQRDDSRSVAVADPPNCNCNSNNVRWQRPSSLWNSHTRTRRRVWLLVFSIGGVVVRSWFRGCGRFSERKRNSEMSPTYTNSMECAGPSDSTRRDCLLCTVQTEYASWFLFRFLLHRRIRRSRFTIFILDAQYLFLIMEVASGNLKVPCEYSIIN